MLSLLFLLPCCSQDVSSTCRSRIRWLEAAAQDATRRTEQLYRALQQSAPLDVRHPGCYPPYDAPVHIDVSVALSCSTCSWNGCPLAPCSWT